MEDCLFCRIAKGEMGTTFVYEDDSIAAFNDIDPKAPVHVLIIPRKHYSTLNDVDTDDEKLMGHIIKTAADIAETEGLAASGYRLVANCQEGAGQSVFHIHFHLLGGRKMTWPPG